MATLHVCDCCGARVKSRGDLWELRFTKVYDKLAPRACSTTGVETFELCDRCKKRAYVACNEGRNGKEGA